MSTNWKAGDKALCVEPTIQLTGHDYRGLPIVGTIYLVERVIPSWKEGILDGGVALVFCGGITAMHIKTGVEVGFRASRFRKIVPACDRATNQEEGLIPHEGFWEGRK